jgi:hypothetical protein
MGRRRAVVVTIVRYELSSALTPLMRDRYPSLSRFIAVESDEDRARFESLGMRPVVDRSAPRGLDLAAAVLRSEGVADEKVRAWMQREQERGLEAAAHRAVVAMGPTPGRTSGDAPATPRPPTPRPRPRPVRGVRCGARCFARSGSRAWCRTSEPGCRTWAPRG